MKSQLSNRPQKICIHFIFKNARERFREKEYRFEFRESSQLRQLICFRVMILMLHETIILPYNSDNWCSKIIFSVYKLNIIYFQLVFSLIEQIGLRGKQIGTTTMRTGDCDDTYETSWKNEKHITRGGAQGDLLFITLSWLIYTGYVSSAIQLYR